MRAGAHSVDHMKTRSLFVIVALALAVTACGGASASEEPVTDSDGAASVTVEDNDFGPANLIVPTGATVTWEWAQGVDQHNVNADGFASPTQDTGTFAHTFDQPGAYDYRCTLHAGMTGTVTVTGE